MQEPMKLTIIVQRYVV